LKLKFREPIFFRILVERLSMKIFCPFIFSVLSICLIASLQDLEAQNSSDLIPTELIIQLEPGMTPELNPDQYEVVSSTLNVYRLRFSRVGEATSFYEDNLMKESTQVLHYNYRIQFRDTLPNDPDYDLQYALQNRLDPGIDVQAIDAWDIARGGVSARGDTIVIAVIDDGVEIEHVDLNRNIFSHRNEIGNTGLDNDDNGYVDDLNGWNVRDNNGQLISAPHGTGVAGIIGAIGNNDTSITGVNWETKILPVTMGENASVAEVIKAYEYVLDQRRLYNETSGEKGAYIVAANNSFGLEGFTYESAPYWCDFFDTLGQEGIITIASAPNRIFDVDEVGDLPTVCPSPYLVTVASTNFNLEWTESGISREHVDVTSYGGNILTLGLNNSTTFSQNSTSSAAAMVSGLVGLMYSVPCPDFVNEVHNDLTFVYEPVRRAIFEGLEEKSFLRNKTQTGGITNFYETLRTLVEPCDTCVAPQNVSFSYINSNEDSILVEPTLLSDSLIWLQRQSGSRFWDTIQAPLIDSFYLEMGPGCEKLEFAFTPICDSVPGTRSQTFTIEDFKNCSACELEYCSPPTYSSKGVWIENVGFEGDVFYSSNDLGYGDYTGEVFTTYETAEEQFLEIRFQKENISDTLAFAAWMDIDHSGTFDPVERIGTLVTSNLIEDVLVLEIPFTALGGLTTLRLGMIPNSNDVNRLTPCNAIPLEAYYEDYCVNVIVNDPICDLVDSVNVLNKTANSLDIAYFPELMPQDEGINVRYRMEGDEEWTRMTHKGRTFIMEDLGGQCITYELDIRRVCEFDTSDYTRFLVETLCPTSAPQEEIRDWTIFPNPFDQALSIRPANGNTSPFTLRIFDSKGSMVLDKVKVSSSGTYRIPLAQDLPAGLYYIQITDEKGQYQQKVLKIEP